MQGVTQGMLVLGPLVAHPGLVLGAGPSLSWDRVGRAACEELVSLGLDREGPWRWGGTWRDRRHCRARGDAGTGPAELRPRPPPAGEWLPWGRQGTGTAGRQDTREATLLLFPIVRKPGT